MMLMAGYVMYFFVLIITVFNACCLANEWFELTFSQNWIDIDKISDESYEKKLCSFLNRLSAFDRRKYNDLCEVEVEYGNMREGIKFVSEKNMERKEHMGRHVNRLLDVGMNVMPRRSLEWDFVFYDLYEIKETVLSRVIQEFKHHYRGNDPEVMFRCYYDNGICSDRTKRLIKNIIGLIREEKDIPEPAYYHEIIVHQRNLDKTLDKLKNFNRIYPWDIDQIKPCKRRKYFLADWTKIKPENDDIHGENICLGSLEIKIPESDKIRIQGRFKEKSAKTILDIYINKDLKTHYLRYPDEVGQAINPVEIVESNRLYNVYPSGRFSEHVFVLDKNQVDELTHLIKNGSSYSQFESYEDKPSDATVCSDENNGYDKDDWYVLMCDKTQHQASSKSYSGRCNGEKAVDGGIIVQKKYLMKVLAWLMKRSSGFSEKWKEEEYSKPVYFSKSKNKSTRLSFSCSNYDINGLSIRIPTSEKESLREDMIGNIGNEEARIFLNYFDIKKITLSRSDKKSFYIAQASSDGDEKLLILDSSGFEELQNQIIHCPEASMDKCNALYKQSNFNPQSSMATQQVYIKRQKSTEV